jgi:hypothetical protein
VDASVSDKHTASILRAEVTMLGSGGIYIELEEGKAEGFLQLACSCFSQLLVSFSEVI